MFFAKRKVKKLEKRVEQLESFEKAVCKIVDGYFRRNEKHNSKYYMDNAIDRFLCFVESVDKRLVLQEKQIEKLSGKGENDGK